MSTAVLVVIGALLAVTLIYLAISFGVFGAAGKAARERRDDDERGSTTGA